MYYTSICIQGNFFNFFPGADSGHIGFGHSDLMRMIQVKHLLDFYVLGTHLVNETQKFSWLKNVYGPTSAGPGLNKQERRTDRKTEMVVPAYNYLRQRSWKDVMYSSLFVCLWRTKLKKFWTNFDEIFRKCQKWSEEEMISFGELLEGTYLRLWASSDFSQFFSLQFLALAAKP